MGTTLTTLNAGSLVYKYIVAIEGYSYLLTSAAPAAAVTAWAGTDWSQALDGIFVEMDNQAAAHPWEPFQRGGTCTLRVTDANGSDTFGIDTHRKLAGAETYLAATADRDDTTITVKDTSAFASSGDAFIGTECFGYSGKTATTFTGCTRGKYSPFTSATGARWSEHHRQGVTASRVSLDPVVSAQPRVWLGKWVAVYLHREVSGVLDVRAEAQLVYAGKIVEIRDDASGCTIVQLKHVMDTIGDAMLHRDQWTAKVVEGLYLRAGHFLGMTDYTSYPATSKTANNLTCVASGASGANQFNEGYYTLQQICDVINQWFGSELAAARIYGTYTIASPVTSSVGLRSKIYYRIPNAGTTQVHWTIKLPLILATFFGFTQNNPGQILDFGTTLLDTPKGRDVSNTNWLFQSVDVPYRAFITHNEGSSFGFDIRMGITDEIGTFVNQISFLPASYNQIAFALGAGLSWGILQFNDAGYLLAAKVGSELRYVMLALGPQLPGSAIGSAPWSGPIDALVVRQDQPGDIVLKQILALEDGFSQLMKRFIYGTGTSGFNGAFDAAGYGLGIAIPGSLLGAAFEASLDALPAASAPIVVVVEKPTKLADLVTTDLLLRWAFPRWRQGTISFASWSVPVNANAVAVLTENTKARPSQTKIDDRAATTLSDEWVHDIITIRYNRDTVSTENYLSYLTFEDATQVDDSGNEGKPITIKARNTYGQFVNTGQGVEQLAPNFLAMLPMFSRPFRKQTLSIGPALFEQLAPGDVVTVSESFARDPSTGRRGVSALPALVIRVRANRGGAQPGNPRGLAAQGEVDIMFGPDQARPAPYSYAATVDETVSGGGFTAGYNSGTLTLRCKAHDNSESSEAVDASRFVNGDKIVIIERDPARPWNAPLSWSRTVNGTPAGNDIVINSALSSPAFDGAKRYRIIYDHFAALQQSQQSLAAQADDADALIENLASPFQYSEAIATSSFTAYTPSTAVELPPNASYGDGQPLDVGHEFALAQLADIVEDYRTAHHLPVLFEDEMTPQVPGSGTPYELLAYFPVWLTAEILTGTSSRTLAVAPMIRSTTGATATIRISLCRGAPTDTTHLDCVRPAVLSEAVFTTTSTTYTTPSAQQLDCNVKDADGVAWIWIEGIYPAASFGLARCDEGPRT